MPTILEDGLTIDGGLPPIVTLTRTHELAAAKEGSTGSASVGQVIDLVDAGHIAGAVEASAAKTALADADLMAIIDSEASGAAKKVTLSNLISSIFKTVRTIANAQFASATFKLFNAAGTPRALSFDTTALTADRTITVPDASFTLSSVFTKFSALGAAEQTITAGGALTLAHGLGEAPKLIAPALICKTAQANYSVGDIIPANLSISTSDANGYGATFEISGSTNIVVRFGNQPTTTFLGVDKTTGVPVGLTNTSWRLIVRAYA